MKPSALSHAGWVLFGGTLVLLIGALVKFTPDTAPQPPPVAPTTSLAPPDNSTEEADATNDLPLPPNFPANLAQIVKMTRAGVDQDVVLAYVQTSGEPYAPTADEMIYLHDSGVSEAILAALVKQKSKPIPAAAPPELASSTAPPPSQNAVEELPNSNATSAPSASIALPETPAPPARPAAGSPAAYFYEDLAPYGDWTQTADGTWAWQPTVEDAVPNWQPYRDGGQWEFTDSGWYWQSSYPWGWAAFHYGGWYNDPSHGWMWQPGNTWAPAWVVWRKSPTHYGWAPLPPGVSFSMAFATQPNNLADYGFTPSSYTFVPVAHFLSHNLARFAARPNQQSALLATSVPVNPRNRAAGVPLDEVVAAVHRPIAVRNLNDVGSPPSRGPNPGAQGLAVYRPALPATTSTREESTSSKSSR